jgi:hypothetical protein
MTIEQHQQQQQQQHQQQQQEPEQEDEVVGRCLDCDIPFDQFSGTVVCTVCRLPVLVCPTCRVHRCLPGRLISIH